MLASLLAIIQEPMDSTKISFAMLVPRLEDELTMQNIRRRSTARYRAPELDM